MTISRREAIALIGACAATGSLNVRALANAQAKPFAPRLPLDEFVQDAQLLSDLRKGVREMKKRPPSDPRSWFFQAAIHGVPAVMIDEQFAVDSALRRSCWPKYWNQCHHFGENSANFLPWHRGYTYYFESILRMHTENDRFSLPYWHYDNRARPNNRYFPKEYGVKHLDGNQENEAPKNINPLYHAERDFYFCGYEHPFATGLPLLMLSETAVDTSPAMTAAVFFGDTEREGLAGAVVDNDPRTRGLLEGYPHDQIHRAVGGIITKIVDGNEVDTSGAMATPPPPDSIPFSRFTIPTSIGYGRFGRVCLIDGGGAYRRRLGSMRNRGSFLMSMVKKLFARAETTLIIERSEFDSKTRIPTAVRSFFRKSKRRM